MSCSESNLIKQFKVDLRSTLKSLQGSIDEGTRFTRTGVDNKELVKKYKNIYTNLSKGTDVAIDNVEAIAELENDIMYTTLRSNLKESFKGSISSGDLVNTKANMDFVLDNVETVGSRVTVKVRSGKSFNTFTFKKGTNVSELSSTGKTLYIPLFEVASSRGFKNIDDVNFEVNKEENLRVGREAINSIRDYLYGNSDVLASDIDSLPIHDGIRRAEYVHGDPEHMKSILKELHIKGSNKASDEHVAYLDDLIGEMSPSFFREMTLYINSNANTTAGWVDVNKNSILLNLGKRRKVGKSESEVYVHEVIHSMTAWALDDNTNTQASDIRRELDFVIGVAADKTVWQDFLEGTEAEATKAQIKVAKDLHEYVFNDKNYKDEFLAHALTNPVVKKHFETIDLKEFEDEATTLFEKLMRIFYKISDALLGNYRFKEGNNNVQEQVHTLAFRLAEINSGAEAEVEAMNPLVKLNEYIDEKEIKYSDWAKGLVEKVGGSDTKVAYPDKNSSALTWGLFVSKFLGKSIVNKHYREALGYGVSRYGIKPNGVVREIVGGLFTPSDLDRMVEWVSLQKTNIQTLRATNISQAKEVFGRGFKEPITEEGDISITRVMLDTNLTQLLTYNSKSVSKKVYTKEDVSKILGEDVGKYLGEATARLEEIVKNIGSENEVNWIKKQSSGLGYYMATHKANLVQLLNAKNIAIGYGSKARRKVDQNLIEAINEVATLTALKYTKKKYKDNLLKLVNNDFNGVHNVANLYESFKDSSSNVEDAHIISGYSKELFDDTTDIQFVPLTKKGKMEEEGYKLVSELEPKAGLFSDVKMGMFVMSTYGRAERLEGATIMGGLNSRGVDIKTLRFAEGIANPDLRAELDIQNLNKEATKLTNRMYDNDKLDFDKEEFGITPILNSVGKVVNYRYMTVDKELKAERMNQDLRASEVLSRSMGGLVDKELREQHNAKVLKVVKELMSDKYWDGSDLGGENGMTEYTRLGPNVTDDKLKELYYMLPKTFRSYAEGRDKKNPVIAVPTNLLEPLFGFTHFQLSDAIPKGVAPKEWRLVVQRVLNMVEAFWVDLVKIAKGNILLKMPIVLIQNIVSNMFFMANTGMGIPTIWRMHKESFRDVKAFMKKHKDHTSINIEVGALIAEKRSTSDKGVRSRLDVKIKKSKEKLKRLEKEMEASPIKELVEAGLYQSVVEDVETSKLNDNNLISNKMDKLLSKAPIIIKTPLQWLYLSQETKWYQVNQEILQLSDLVARDVMNRKQKELEIGMANGTRTIPKELLEEFRDSPVGFHKALGVDGNKLKLVGEDRERFLEISKKRRMNFLLDSFINYNKPQSKVLSFVDRLGLTMFLKYVIRIQRVLARMTLEHPIRSFGMLAASSVAIDVSTIQDSGYIARGFGNDSEFSPGNMVNFYTPWDHVKNVVTPPLLKL